MSFVKLAFLALTVVLLAACQGQPEATQVTSTTPPMILKTYSVPVPKTERLVHALHSVTDDSHTKVSTPFPGTILVYMPADQQVSVTKAIATLGEGEDNATASDSQSSFHVHFWVVDAIPGTGVDSAMLKPLTGTLDTLRKRLGPSHFKLVDAATSMAQAGLGGVNQLATSGEREFKFAVATEQNSQIQLKIQYHSFVNNRAEGLTNLETTSRMQVGNYMVLAQAANAIDQSGGDAEGVDPGMRLLVVRVDRADQSAPLVARMSVRENALYASYRRLEKPLYNVLYRKLWQAEECQDLIQDTYLRIWTRRDKVEEATLDHLVWTTALNLTRNRLRWRRLWRMASLDTIEPLRADSSDQDFLATRQLHHALETLPAASREVLLLSEFSGLSGAEIAKILDIPVGTVASRKHKAMQRLKKELGENHA